MQVITDNATSPFAFSSQTSQIAGTTTAGVFSAYSLTNGGYLNCGNPDVGWVNMTYLAGRHIFSLAGTEAMRITGGNVLINTTTDAGFKLDVNGTARVVTSILVGSGSGTGTVQTGVSRATYFNSYSNSHTIFEVKSSGNASFYQGAAFGTTSDCVASAQVQIDSTTKGFLKPRLTTTEKNAIASPAAGLEVFDTTLNRPCFYDGTTWITL